MSNDEDPPVWMQHDPRIKDGGGQTIANYYHWGGRNPDKPYPDWMIIKNAYSFYDNPVVKCDSDYCPICHTDEFKDKVYLKCGHPYCKDCISNWFNVNTRCPLCGEIHE
jgi:hypothetical protein